MTMTGRYYGWKECDKGKEGDICMLNVASDGTILDTKDTMKIGEDNTA